MIKKISDFIHSFKNSVVEAEELASKYNEQINSFALELKEEGLNTQFEENFLTILGYTYRLNDVSQRLFFTFQEAVYAIDLDKLMKNEDSLKLNSIVYILVLDVLITEYNTKEINEEQKQKALEVYKKIEERKSQENKKYHMYQY
ncbi:hypothetical protein [Arcobacter sp. LA11]|uniref:hypothetical protein n=1 Tax=Arcobacter sp. LA11 TaxID=1898176 RepID=UPI000932693A|nr:hypothetical protein [Arcobacter sp. LA11]